MSQSNSKIRKSCEDDEEETIYLEDEDGTTIHLDDVDDEEPYFVEDGDNDEGILDGVLEEPKDEILDREAEYTVLSMKDMIKKQTEEIQTIIDYIGVTEATAKLILRAFRWNSEKILNAFSEEGRDSVLIKAGLSPSDDSLSTPATSHSASTTNMFETEEETSTFECPTCFCDYTFDETMRLACGHRFCNTCWATDINMKIKDGLSKQIKCMGMNGNKKCEHVIPDNVILKYITDKNLKEKFEQNILNSFVEDNKQMKWCPSTPFCGNCILRTNATDSPLEITCHCGKQFCFSCGNEPHLPATCAMIKAWKQKCQDDSETFNWLAANTKDCPKCSKPIEKNGGCNHMHCRACNHHFCWVCLGPFDHSTYQHSCGKYKEETTTTNARTSLRRYLHYYERYKAHEDSRKKETKLKENVKKKMEDLLRIKPESAWVEIQWIEKASHVLFLCRHILQFSYVFGYYLFDDCNPNKKLLEGCREFDANGLKIAQNNFEDKQELLENITEKISYHLQQDVSVLAKEDKTKKDILGFSAMAQAYTSALLEVIADEMMLESYILPMPDLVLATATQTKRTSTSLIQDQIAKKQREEQLKKEVEEAAKLGVIDLEPDLQIAIAQSLELSKESASSSSVQSLATSSQPLVQTRKRGRPRTNTTETTKKRSRK